MKNNTFTYKNFDLKENSKEPGFIVMEQILNNEKNIKYIDRLIIYKYTFLSIFAKKYKLKIFKDFAKAMIDNRKINLIFKINNVSAVFIDKNFPISVLNKNYTLVESGSIRLDQIERLVRYDFCDKPPNTKSSLVVIDHDADSLWLFEVKIDLK